MLKKHCYILIHGYMSVKADMQGIADALVSKSYEVHNVSLAGHDNATEEEFVNNNWNEWFKSVEEQFLFYKTKGYTVTLIGHSLGGVLALALNQKHRDNCISSLVIIASPLYLNRLSRFEILHPLSFLISLLKPFTKKIHRKYFNLDPAKKEGYYYPRQLASMKENMHKVWKNLYKITAPILILQAIGDKTVPQSCPKEIERNVSSKYKKVMMYTMLDETSKKHQIVTHPETKEKIIDDIFNFIEETQNLEHF